MRSRVWRVVVTLEAAMVGYVVGFVFGHVGNFPPRQTDFPFLVGRVPLPHRVPEHKGGLSFRFAMAHDVIHERFARHGELFYRERDRINREKLATLAADDPKRFTLVDDLGVGLDRMGRPAEAIPLLREKLEAQRRSGQEGRALYTSYANLGTFLIHANFAKAAGGDEGANEGMREGIDFVRESVRVNPEAHFGRERWQAAIAEFLRATIADPALLTEFDCLGNRLDLSIDLTLYPERANVVTNYGRPGDPDFGKGWARDEVPRFFSPELDVEDPKLWDEMKLMRKHVTKVGAEEGWERTAAAIPSHRVPTPFDEPMLGIIGMWREGGGANPHFALAIGETMLRVGQRYLAWSAFERASRLADRFGSDAAAHEALRTHCRKRQGEIEATFSPAPTAERRQNTDPLPTGETAADLRSGFDAELQFGMAYQRDFQEFEAEKLRAGVIPKSDGAFFAEFEAKRGKIASPVGDEEWFLGVPSSARYAHAFVHRNAIGVFAAGGVALAVAMLMKRSRRPEVVADEV